MGKVVILPYGLHLHCLRPLAGAIAASIPFSKGQVPQAARSLVSEPVRRQVPETVSRQSVGGYTPGRGGRRRRNR